MSLELISPVQVRAKLSSVHLSSLLSLASSSIPSSALQERKQLYSFRCYHGSLWCFLSKVLLAIQQRLMFPWQPGEVNSHELDPGKELWSQNCVRTLWLPSPFSSFPMLTFISRTDVLSMLLVERTLRGEADQPVWIIWEGGGEERADQSSLLKVG